MIYPLSSDGAAGVYVSHILETGYIKTFDVYLICKAEIYRKYLLLIQLHSDNQK